MPAGAAMHDIVVEEIKQRVIAVPMPGGQEGVPEVSSREDAAPFSGAPAYDQ